MQFTRSQCERPRARGWPGACSTSRRNTYLFVVPLLPPPLLLLEHRHWPTLRRRRRRLRCRCCQQPLVVTARVGLIIAIATITVAGHALEVVPFAVVEGAAGFGRCYAAGGIRRRRALGRLWLHSWRLDGLRRVALKQLLVLGKRFDIRGACDWEWRGIGYVQAPATADGVASGTPHSATRGRAACLLPLCRNLLHPKRIQRRQALCQDALVDLTLITFVIAVHSAHFCVRICGLVHVSLRLESLKLGHPGEERVVLPGFGFALLCPCFSFFADDPLSSLTV